MSYVSVNKILLRVHMKPGMSLKVNVSMLTILIVCQPLHQCIKLYSFTKSYNASLLWLSNVHTKEWVKACRLSRSGSLRYTLTG